MTRSLVALTDLVAAVRHAADARTGWTDTRPARSAGFAPPGDIHRIRNVGDESAISLHVYGTDITRVGSSARRFYN